MMAAMKHCAHVASGVKSPEEVMQTPLCDPPHSHVTEFKFFLPQNVLGREPYRLKMDQASEYCHLHHHKVLLQESGPRFSSTRCHL